MIERIQNKLIAGFIVLWLTMWLGLSIIFSNHYIEQPWFILSASFINALGTMGVLALLFVFPLLLKKELKFLLILLDIFIGLLILFELLSLLYFSVTLRLIDQTIFQFSFEQATIILDAYIVFEWYYLLIPVPVIAYLFLAKRTIVRPLKAISMFFFALGFFLVASVFHILIYAPSEHQYKTLSNNKLYYFIVSRLSRQEKVDLNLTPQDIQFYQFKTQIGAQNLAYPLYRPTNKSNTLAPFFDLTATPPNIVLIIVESLSSSLSGPHADEISYTPFLDSLANHSLYFDNAIATAERSFAALPSMIGSLPHGKKGFTNNATGYPNNETVASWLFDNGYVGDFLYGGYARFDNMDLFLHDQGFHNIYDHKEYNYEGTGLQTSIDDVPFGIPDGPFLQSAVDIANQRSGNQPYFDVYFTLSMHYPYILENEEKYLSKTKEMIQTSNVSKQIKDKHKKYTKELATFLYTDDALREYFQQQQQREEHQNTIYLIVGDHMMGEIAQASPIEKYRSVMMIYSPLLKRSKMIKAVNSHLDIAPSLYNLIQQPYAFSALDSVAWLGQPFDTSSTFSCNRNILFMLNDRSSADLLHNTYFLSQNKVYQTKDRLRLAPINDPSLLTDLKKLHAVSIALHADVVGQNRLIPSYINMETIATVNQTVILDENQEYGSIYNTILKQAETQLSFTGDFHLSGDWTNSDTDEDNPKLIYSVNRKDSTIIWEKVDLNLADLPINNERKISFILKNQLNFEFQEGDDIRVYFWNNSLSKNKYQIAIQNMKIRRELNNH